MSSNKMLRIEDLSSPGSPKANTNNTNTPINLRSSAQTRDKRLRQSMTRKLSSNHNVGNKTAYC